MIQSVQNKLIKKIASLKQKKYRDELNLFCVEGIRPAEEAILAGWPVEMCLHCRPANSRTAIFLDKLSSIINPSEIIEVSAEVYAKITDTKEPQGIMLVLPKRSFTLEQIFSSLKNTQTPLIAVLDNVSDPGNAGAIVRTANAAGCAGVVFLTGSADLFNSKTLRSAMGSVFHIPIVTEAERQHFAVLCQKHSLPILAAALQKDGRVYYKEDLKKPLAIVLGNEGSGVGAEMSALANGIIYIPINAAAESLNVAVAAGIIFFEAAKQQQHSNL